jgi:dTDP-4-dehydrorhamnose 3,5-epimerase
VTLPNPQVSLSRIEAPGGSITRFIRSDEGDFPGFGEVYFTSIEPGAVKAWRRHSRANLFLTVVYGEVLVVLRDSPSEGSFILSSERPTRLSIAAGTWFGFSGSPQRTGIICSFSDLPHDPDEVERASIDAFPHDWRMS